MKKYREVLLDDKGFPETSDQRKKRLGDKYWTSGKHRALLLEIPNIIQGQIGYKKLYITWRFGNTKLVGIQVGSLRVNLIYG